MGLVKGIWLLLVGTGLAGSAAAAPRTFAQIQASGALRICYTPWRGSDTDHGFPSPYLDIAVEFARSMKLRPEVNPFAWEAQFQDEHGLVREGAEYTPRLFASGQCDLQANNLAPLAWRTKLMAFNWLTSSQQLIVVRKSRRSEFKRVEDLRGKRTVVVPNTSYHQTLLALNAGLGPDGGITISEAKSGGTLSQLLDGKVDFVVLEATLAMFDTLHVSKDLAWAFPVSEPSKVGWGFPKGADQLLAASERYLQSARQAPASAVNRVFTKYFGLSLLEYDNLQFLLTTP